MPLTSKGRKILRKLSSEYGSTKKGKSVLYAMKNKGTVTGIDKRRFLDAVKRQGSLDSVMKEMDPVEEAWIAGTGKPLVPRLLGSCFRDAAREGGKPHEIVKRAIDKRMMFLGTKDDEMDMIEDSEVQGLSSEFKGVGPNENKYPLGLKGAFSNQDEHEGFEKLDHELAHKPGVEHAAALAAWIGRKKYGAAGMAKKSAAGRK